MKPRKVRWGVVVKDLYYNEQHLERHRPSHYVAKVVQSNPAELDGNGGRVEVFGRTIQEVDFLEVESEEEAKQIAKNFTHEKYEKTRNVRCQ